MANAKLQIQGTVLNRESGTRRFVVTEIEGESELIQARALSAVGFIRGYPHPLNPSISMRDYTINMLGTNSAEVIINYAKADDPDRPDFNAINLIDISVNVVLINRTVTHDADGKPLKTVWAGRGVNPSDPCYIEDEVKETNVVPVEKLVPQIEVTIVVLEKYTGGTFGVQKTPWEKSTELTGRINSLDFIGSARNKWLCTGVGISEGISDDERQAGFDVSVTYKFRHADLAKRQEIRADADWNVFIRFPDPQTGLPVPAKLGAGGAEDLARCSIFGNQAGGGGGNQFRGNGFTQARVYGEVDFNAYFPRLDQHKMFSKAQAAIEDIKKAQAQQGAAGEGKAAG